MFSNLDVMQVLSSANVLSLGVPTVSVTAFACVLVGYWRDRRRYTQSIAAYDAAEERRVAEQAAAQWETEQRQNQCVDEVLELIERLVSLDYMLCGTNELIENERLDACEERGEVYERPEPLKGAQELSIEVNMLYVFLSQLRLDLVEGRSWDLDTEYYRRWTEALHKRCNQWRELEVVHALSDLEKLALRCKRLEQLCILHGAKPVPCEKGEAVWYPIETYQNLYKHTAFWHRSIEEYCAWIRTSGMIDTPISVYADLVEKLDLSHRSLENHADLFGSTKEAIKEEARKQWREVIEHTTETRPDLLYQYLSVSIAKYLQGYSQTRRAFLGWGHCGQKKALEFYRKALIHWSCSQALMLVLREQMHTIYDLAEPTTLEFCAEDFDLAVIWRCEQDLKDFQASIQAFNASYEDNFSKFVR